MDIIPSNNNQPSLYDLLQELYEIQEKDWKRVLIPGDQGRNCPSNPACCDECDYLMCCTNDNGFCDKCFAENGFCEIEESGICAI